MSDYKQLGEYLLPPESKTMPSEPSKSEVAVSPTGAPWLPPKAVPVLVAIVGIAAAIDMAGLVPPHTVGATLLKGIVALGAMMGLASPGMRKPS